LVKNKIIGPLQTIINQNRQLCK